MPFAPYDLSENVVRANWTKLHLISIIGNNLDFITGSKLGVDHLGRAPCTQAAQTLAIEASLWDGDLDTWLIRHLRNQIETDQTQSSPKECPSKYLAHSLDGTICTFRQAPVKWPTLPPMQEPRGHPRHRSRLWQPYGKWTILHHTWLWYYSNLIFHAIKCSIIPMQSWE